VASDSETDPARRVGFLLKVQEVTVMASKIKALFSRPKGQAMAEFSMALPILMLVVIGLFEAGRALFMYASVVNASREAVRYATAYGVDENDILHVQNCAEIRNTARRVGFLLPLEDDGNIVIEYDTGTDPVTGVTPPPYDSCDAVEGDATNGVDTGIEPVCGDRVVVTVSADYNPIIPLLIPPLKNHTFTSSSARTYLGVVELSADADPCN
jgi:hypothetical protein